jgi:O-methyltransferase
MLWNRYYSTHYTWGARVNDLASPSSEQDEIELALAVLRRNAGDESIAARIFDRILIDVVKPHHRSMYWGDRLLSLDKSAGFQNEPRFQEILAQVDVGKGCNQYASPDRLGWRLHLMLWASRLAMRVPGDFVECGVTHGDMPWIITEEFDFKKAGKRFFGYDTFNGFDFRYSSEADFPEAPQFFHRLHRESRVDPLRYEKVAARFKSKPYVKIIKGTVPDTLHDTAPDRIAFLHLDMNAPIAQKEALAFLYDRLSDGAILVFDDYGWILYRREKEVADEYLEARGQRVLEFPTGQGIAIISKSGNAITGKSEQKRRTLSQIAAGLRRRLSTRR